MARKVAVEGGLTTDGQLLGLKSSELWPHHTFYCRAALNKWPTFQTLTSVICKMVQRLPGHLTSYVYPELIRTVWALKHFAKPISP